ncbi:MAG: GTPase ObgE [Planctomycetota bacterium]|nr:GTPase ObgE [Planctomycetota bacterium]
MFLDEAAIRVRSGSGGRGCVSFRREKFVPKGGPDGGNGGNGGSVLLRANRNLSSLLDIGRRREYVADNGRPGMGNNRSGRGGRSLTVDVPIGTVVREVLPGVAPDQGRLLSDLDRHGKKVCVAQGGRGGRGNRAFASATRRVPRIAQDGEPAEQRALYLELKLVADVGLVGLPNAGKSTLLSRLSAATPKIADYPFTTLKPNLGIVELGDYSRLVFADIPGLIEGAHQGHGLGIEFLRHVERTRVIVHLLSAEQLEIPRLVTDYQTIEAELASHSELLAGKPRIVALSKMDLVAEERQLRLVEGLETALRQTVVPISAVTGKGLERLLRAVCGLVEGKTLIDD